MYMESKLKMNPGKSHSHCCEKPRRKFRTFSNITHMHGFYEVANARSNFWKISWIFIVIGAIGVTTFQTYKTVLQYATQTTLTLIEPLDTTLLFPPLTLCFQHWISWVNWKKAYSMNFTKESLLYGFSFLTNIFSPAVFDTNAAKIALLRTMERNNISTMSEFYRRIAKPLPMVMGLYDHARLVDKPPFFNDIVFQMKGSDVFLCYRVVGEDVLRIIKGNGTDESISFSKNNLFNFSTQDFKYQFISHYMTEDEFSFNVGYWLLVKTNYWLTTLPDFVQNFTAFPFPYRVYPDAYSDKYVEISTEFDSFSIEMTPTTHRWTNKDTAPCREKQKAISTDTDCVEKCDADRVNHLNVCLPLDDAVLLGLDYPDRLCQNPIFFIPTLFQIYATWNRPISDLFAVDDSFDNTSEPIDSETLSKIEKDFASCKKACISACEIWQYQFTSSAAIQPMSVRQFSFVNQTDVNIYYPDAKSVLIIIEQNAQTWEDFVANVGGLLGVWTGASILSFLQIAYYCCCYECSCTWFTKVVHPPIHIHDIHSHIHKHPRIHHSEMNSNIATTSGHHAGHVS